MLSLPAPGSIPGWETKIPQAMQQGQKKKAFMNHKEKKQGNEAKKITFKIEIKYTKIFYHSNR